MSVFNARFVVSLLLVTVLVAACGGGDDDEPDSTPTPEGAASGATGPQGSSIESYTDVQPAVIQIVSRGTFRDPELGLADGSGAGSGFIISPDGLAITNNHVVAGAATIEVFIGGDDGRGYNASVVGVSECNDIALIDIREDDPLPFLDWYDGEVAPGTDVYAAGFPLGDPEFTLTRGIVSKARANGESDWSSLDYSIEHDAQIQGGNSGGPLVTTEGKVLGVNYASSTGTNSSIYYAIPGEIAQDVMERLKSDDYETIGINGWAVFDEALNISGVWVAGVTAGSPAAKAGIQAGDIITALNGLPMALDGTMADYCDVFRTHGDDEPMTVEVLRYDTGETLRGEINSDTTLEVVSVAAAIEEEIDDDTSLSGPDTYSGYQSITDDTDTIIVDVPVEWNEIYTNPCDYQGGQIPCVSAAPNVTAFREYDESGLFFALYGPNENINDLLSVYAPVGCTDAGIYDYEDPVFTGLYQYWESCGSSSYVVILAAKPSDGSYTAVVWTAIVVEADWDALDEVFNTFNVLQ